MVHKLLFLGMIYEDKTYLLVVDDIEYIILVPRDIKDEYKNCFIIEYNLFEKCEYYNTLIEYCEFIDISNIIIPTFKNYTGSHNNRTKKSPIYIERIRKNKLIKTRKQKLKYIGTL